MVILMLANGFLRRADRAAQAAEVALVALHFVIGARHEEQSSLRQLLPHINDIK